MMAGKHDSKWQAWQRNSSLRVSILNNHRHEQRDETRSSSSLNSQSLCLSDITSSSRPHILNLPKQNHQLGPSIQMPNEGGTPHSNYHRDWRRDAQLAKVQKMRLQNVPTLDGTFIVHFLPRLKNHRLKGGIKNVRGANRRGAVHISSQQLW